MSAESFITIVFLPLFFSPVDSNLFSFPFRLFLLALWAALTVAARLGGQALADYWIARGKMQADQKNYSKARGYYRAAIFCCPVPKIYVKRGLFLANFSQYSLALRDFDQALILDDQYAYGYCCRGFTYNVVGEYQKALADLDRSIALDPTYGRAYNNRGVSHLNLGDEVKALADFDRAISCDPRLSRAYYNRGHIFLTRNNYAFAIDDFDRAIALDPHYARAYYDRGVSYWQGSQDSWKVWSDLNTALRLGLDSSTAQTAESVLSKLDLEIKARPFMAA